MSALSPESAPPSRREFLRLAGAGLVIAACPLGLMAQEAAAAPAPKPEKPPALDPEMVRTFVGASHRDLEKVRGLYEAENGLLNATWDWGGGDWETGLGAASHVGHVEVAEFLLSKGARMDVFAAVMLGRTELFEAFLKVDPRIHLCKGPHGLSLLHHAEKGGQDALAARIKGLSAAG